jgi:osmotically-inducible protein OsmY
MKTDAQVREDVLAELKQELSVTATQIGVEGEDGIATLAGRESSHAEKGAERTSQGVSGVKALAIEMDVKLPVLRKRHDADIARAAAKVLEWMTILPKDSVKVMVEGGWITLTGEVYWPYQRQVATEGVRNLMGVTGVSDDIAIRPRVPLGAIKTGIEALLKRRAWADARNISVEVDDGHVTLTGSVHSWAERELAWHAARGTPGVRSVDDHVTVDY